MTIEETLDNLNEKGVSAVLILKANEGYSAIPVYRPEYSSRYLLRNHLTGKTVLDALKKLRGFIS